MLKWSIYSNHVLTTLISPNTITKQYDELFLQSMSSLKSATERYIQKEAEIAMLKQEIASFKTK